MNNIEWAKLVSKSWECNPDISIEEHLESVKIDWKLTWADLISELNFYGETTNNVRC